MKQVTNCKNCGSALDPWKPNCQFCGTKNVNLTALDLASGEPANFIFKMPSNLKVVDKDGAEIYMTILAIPSLEMMTMISDSTDVYGGNFGAPVMRYNTGNSLEVGLKLKTVYQPNKEKQTLCELRVGDGE